MERLGVAEFLNEFQVSEKELTRLCRELDAKSLSVFGSALNDNFIKGKSDLDFLVEFDVSTFDLFFNFRDRLSRLFKYEKVDLITVGSLKNNIVKEEIFASRKILYAA